MRGSFQGPQARSQLSASFSVYVFQSACVAAKISRSPCSPCGSSGASGHCSHICGGTVPGVLLTVSKLKGGIHPILDLKVQNVFTLAQRLCIESTRSVIASLTGRLSSLCEYQECAPACPQSCSASVIPLFCCGPSILSVCAFDILLVLCTSVNKESAPHASFTVFPGHHHCGISG